MKYSEEEAIEIAKKHIGNKANNHPCDFASYISQEKIEANQKELEKIGNPSVMEEEKPHWVLGFKFPCPGGGVRDPSHFFVEVYDDGRVKTVYGL